MSEAPTPPPVPPEVRHYALLSLSFLLSWIVAYKDGPWNQAVTGSVEVNLEEEPKK